jgi:amino acid transporter
MTEASERSTSLKKSFGLITLAAFGIGDILGAGIYGLIGNIAGEVGNAVWLSFLAAFIVAAFTGLSYAELGARMPMSGGEAQYAKTAFRRKSVAYLIGFLVLLSGLVSISTVSHIFANYMTAEDGLLPAMAPWIVRVVFMLLIAGFCFWGIRQSSIANVVCTLIELTGLGIVIVVALPSFGSVNYLDFDPGGNGGGSESELPLMLILQGGVLAFYAFIGFEDLANVAEEVKDARKTLPRAIILSLAVAAVIYGLVAIAAVSVVPHDELSDPETKGALLLVVKNAAPGFPIGLFTIIALFAVTNTALVNFVMGSRLIYGMARQSLLPGALGSVHEKRGTPDRAILAILAVTLVLTLTLDKSTLAGTTSLILLIVFFVVNLSLVVLKLRGVEAPEGTMRVPLVVPILGLATALVLAMAVKQRALMSFLILAPAGICVYLLWRLGVRLFSGRRG